MSQTLLNRSRDLSRLRRDDAPLEEACNAAALMLRPQDVAWQAGNEALAAAFTQEGILYYLFECDNVEPFADRTVYLAVYPGTHIPPNAETFAVSDEGHISVKAGAEVALFTLPLDESKADPEKVAAMGFDSWEPLEMGTTEGEPFGGAVQLIPEEPAESSFEGQGEVKDYTQTQIAILPSMAPQN